MDASEADRWDLLLGHRDAVVSIVRRKVRNTAEAEDCVHDAILRLVRRPDLDPERVRSLLTKVAVGLAIDRYRSTQSRDRAVVRLGGAAVSAAISPQDVLAETSEAERIIAAVDALPPRERQVLRLRIQGFGVADAARLLRLSYKTVEGAYTRARQHVRKALQGLIGWLGLRRRLLLPPGEATAMAGIAGLFLIVPLVHGLFGDYHDQGSPPASRGSVAAVHQGGGLGESSGGTNAAQPNPWSDRDGPDAHRGGGGEGHGRPGQDDGKTTIGTPIEIDSPPQAPGPPIVSWGVSISGLPPDVSTDPSVVIGGLQHCESGAEQQLQQGIDTERSIC